MTTKPSFALAKPCFDIGYFTNNPTEMLAFWREEMGLPFEAPVEFNDGLTQYRHALGDHVIKINTARGGVGNPPTGYAELIIAQPECTSPKSLSDPDGNRITIVPPGESEVQGVGLRLHVHDVAVHRAFFRDTLRFEELPGGAIRSGNSILLLEQSTTAKPAGHWVNQGLRYFTLHVMRIDETFNAMIDAGAVVGEEPYSIGQIARISFVRDPDGNWIEVAQRAALAGLW